MTLNQVDVDVDENEEEADHQDHQDTDTDIKPFPSSSPHQLFSLPAFPRTEVPLSFLSQSQCFKSGGKLTGQGVTKGVSSTAHQDLWQPGGVLFSRRSSGCDGGGGGGDFAKLSGAHRIFEKPNCGRGQILKVKVS